MGALMATEEGSDQELTPKEQELTKRKLWLAIIIMIGIASIVIRLLTRYEFDNSALLYVGIPFLISLAIAAFRPLSSEENLWHAFRNHNYIALIVFLSSSVVLFEGFVCVLFFMPIYFIIVSIGYAIARSYNNRKNRNGSTLVSLLPLLILATSLEGTSDNLSLDRESHVIVSKVTNLSPAEVMHNISLPFDLQKDRDWLIAVFPMMK